MGNTPTTSATANLVIGIKRAQESQNSKLYRLVDYNGEGELIQWMKYSMSIGDYNILDGLIELKITPFLYGGGKGKLVPISELVKMRNDERNALLSTLRRKKGKGKSGPNILENVNQDNMQGDMMKALKRLDGGGGKQGGASKYRELCWDISQRGAMGETLVHICLLNGTHLHNEVAKILIRTFPKLVNDIYLSEEYYGQSPLHQAIVNEDIAMVRFLLQHGADVHQRCYGAFFCPDDQKESRTDSLEHEWVDIHQNTNYAGRTYWGEYPLSFAACTRQPDCCRMLKAAKADLNMRDTNGNTVLHLMVIHELPMFNHVLNYEKEELWTYGSVTWIAYPLSNIDTIEEQTGDLMPISALSLIVFGETSCHLQLIDGLIENVLEAKWKVFGKRRSNRLVGPFVIMFYKMMAGDVFRFLLIYVIFLFGFSQAFFIIFLGCHRGMNTTEILSSSSERMPPPDTLAHPLEAMARLFMVNVGEFQILYKVLDTCRLATLGKVWLAACSVQWINSKTAYFKFVFIFFQILVSLLLINMFIASMTRTYEAVNETQMEWKRQDEEETEKNKSKSQTADVLEKKKIAYKKNLVNNMF
ncbi:ankyrin repeat-containing domain protein [Trichinella spiralis]|uniref:ankyrin repeat-containing domain protein n=1 Tax=Trichinella spiralis TaxID=6334 RepID=UPI0001EFBEE0|nr:ankyrin repeat-containing domain protein [Trichinella spiralis]